ncbi:MAG: type 1 glutamine amidotransferase [Anaerolineales bacterium]|nr:type 1 glutamine amidotransferase [Anaerolineales bacterium]MDW8161670.1 type 1 glutamine amidotransferase domain-containing protein [Anaerolineales bacterium]
MSRLVNRTIAFLVAHEFEDLELLYPLLRLSEEGASILLVAVPMGHHPRPYLPDKPVTGRFGHPVPIPVMPPGRHYRMEKLENLRAEDLDGIVLPGGFSPDYLRRNPAVLDLVRACHARGKVIAAICHAPWVLISAGIAKGKRMTGVVALRDDLINAGAIFLDEPVVRDGNLITSRRPDDLPDFCKAIIEALSETQPA